jgi:hypothetical protein
MFYKALGWAVWKGARWYLGRKLPSRKLMLAAVAALAVVATVIAAGAKRDELPGL